VVYFSVFKEEDDTAGVWLEVVAVAALVAFLLWMVLEFGR
jgi:hypothetical protein